MIIRKIKQKSKKNQVFLVETREDVYIEKIFTKASNFNSELKAYNILKSNHMHLPKIKEIKAKELIIVYEYIKGDTFAELVEKDDAECKFIILGEWLKKLHQISSNEGQALIVDDVNLKNFIISKYGIIPVDYEDYKYGDEVSDVAGILAFINNYNVKHKESSKYKQAFIKGYYKDEKKHSNLYEEISKWENILKTRRISKSTI